MRQVYRHNLISVCYREIFPYLVVFVGLENVLVITKSVVSTPVDLDVRLRIAQGQSTGSRAQKNWKITPVIVANDPSVVVDREAKSEIQVFNSCQ